MRTQYVLIDYENVQPAALEALAQEHFKVMLFVGANQARIRVEVAAQLQGMGSNAEYIRMAGNGPNALDFHIAYYIGRLAATDPAGYFHIISRDSGFDPLVAHLKAKGILACRSRDVTEMPVVKAALSRTPAERIEVVVANLKQRGAARPRTVKTLSSTINALFQKTLAEGEVAALLARLQAQGFVKINETRVAYSLPD